MMRVSELHFLVALRTHINMSKALQVVFCCALVAVVVQARPGYLGYPYGAAVSPYGAAVNPYGAAVNPYGAVPYAAAAHAVPLPVHDTPEVAAAKAAHFAAYNVAAAAAAAAPDNGAYAGAYGSPQGHYVGPLAGVPVLVNGVPADTPEVHAAKAAHFAAYAQAAHGGHHYG